MLISTGAGPLVLVFFVTPIIIVGGVLYYGFGIDVLRTNSWWPLHSLMIMGAILTFAIGSYMNRKMIEEVTYEKSGPVTTMKPRHTLYAIRMEYWGPITLALYFAFVAYRSFR
jgi:hypothetical protein